MEVSAPVVINTTCEVGGREGENEAANVDDTVVEDIGTELSAYVELIFVSSIINS